MRSLAELRRWAEEAPSGTTVSVEGLRELLDELEERVERVVELVEDSASPSWRERLWTVPDQTRMGVEDVAEALGRSVHTVYRAAAKTRRVPTGATGKNGEPGFTEEPNGHRLPSRKIGGQLVFTARDVRAWIQEEEQG